jgi:hypothetical protein
MYEKIFYLLKCVRMAMKQNTEVVSDNFHEEEIYTDGFYTYSR